MKTKEKAVAVVEGNLPQEGRRVQRLKPERVQEGLALRRTLQQRKVVDRLERLPGWKLAPGGRAIGKVRAIADPQHAAAYAAFAVSLAAVRHQPLRLTFASGQLAVTLRSRSGHGIPGTLLDFAAELG